MEVQDCSLKHFLNEYLETINSHKIHFGHCIIDHTAVKNHVFEECPGKYHNIMLDEKREIQILLFQI